MKPIQSPYAIGYSSSFAIDEPKNAETLLALWKTYDNGDLNAGKGMIADSIEMYMADGMSMHATRDSATAIVQKFRSSLKAAVSHVDAVMALKSTDKNEHWACIWGTEIDTHKDGKIDSVYLQETWRFNKDGKADLLLQSSRKLLPMKK
jgi:hypothetical protein